MSAGPSSVTVPGTGLSYRSSSGPRRRGAPRSAAGGADQRPGPAVVKPGLFAPRCRKPPRQNDEPYSTTTLVVDHIQAGVWAASTRTSGSTSGRSMEPTASAGSSTITTCAANRESSSRFTRRPACSRSWSTPRTGLPSRTVPVGRATGSAPSAPRWRKPRSRRRRARGSRQSPPGGPSPYPAPSRHPRPLGGSDQVRQLAGGRGGRVGHGRLVDVLQGAQVGRCEPR